MKLSPHSAAARGPLLGAMLVALLVGCATTSAATPATESPASPLASVTTQRPAPTTVERAATEATTDPQPAATTLPLPTATEPAATGVYAHTGIGEFSPAVADARAYVYVPSNDQGTVTVIDQASMRVVDQYYVGKLVQHVVPDWGLGTLYATASNSNRLVPIDPATGSAGEPVAVDAPYNLYFTPDGTKSVVMAERRNRIDFYDRTTWKLLHSTHTPCKGVNHADWSPDGSWFVATCEFSGDIIKVDTNTGDILNVIALPGDAKPQDIRIVPDGSKFYVADMNMGGLWILDETGTTILGSLKTGRGTHAIYPNRDATLLYVTNRGRLSWDTRRHSRPGEGSISVVDPRTDTVVDTWEIDGGGSPDMGGVSADGTVFWVSGRYDDVVYAFDTRTGALLTTIDVPREPHGLAVFPQPGRYSLGHTGNYR